MNNAKFKWVIVGAVIVIVGAAVWIWYQKGKVDNVRQAWYAVLGKCASTDTIGKQAIFFGASNAIGPGSVWRQAEDGSFRLRFELSDAEPDPIKRSQMITSNNVATCQGGEETLWEFSSGLPFDGKITPVAADISADLKRATKELLSTLTPGIWMS